MLKCEVCVHLQIVLLLLHFFLYFYGLGQSKILLRPHHLKAFIRPAILIILKKKWFYRKKQDECIEYQVIHFLLMVIIFLMSVLTSELLLASNRLLYCSEFLPQHNRPDFKQSCMWLRKWSF